MMYVEMSRSEQHGGGSWSFANCVWAPTRKKSGGTWPFWSKIAQIKCGDMVLHLRGISPDAYFVGWSCASTDGFQTTLRPPDPKGWGFAESFYRANLRDFVPFDQPINLATIFEARRDELVNYLNRNQKRGAERANLFYVRQSDRLQCLNGAYLSDADEGLLTALFGNTSDAINRFTTQDRIISVTTGVQIATIRARLGQARFSYEIKKLYGNRCCFPGCGVADAGFTVAAHIARWSDNESLRGQLGNGLCFCLMHDRAFELGLFTLDAHFRVFVNPKGWRSESSFVQGLILEQGRKILVAPILPLEEALLEHWTRIGIEMSDVVAT